MKPGLPQGYVRLGSDHHLVLQAMHELGLLRQRDLVEDLGMERRRASVALARLAEAGLIHRHPPARAYDTGDRTQAVWGLTPYTGSKPLNPSRVPGQVRTARYRSAKRMRVASVFAYRPQGASA